MLLADRFDAATYLCGYAVEIALKARICRALDWSEFPSTPRDFQGFTSFRTHDLDILLRLSGQEPRIKQDHFAWWIAMLIWSPESRYRSIGSVTPPDAEALVEAAEALLEVL